MNNTTYTIHNVRKTRQEGGGFTLELERLEIGRGERVALVGPSGCGKSTALDILAGVLRPDAAERLEFSPEAERTEDLAALWRKGRRDALAALRLRHVGYVLQTGGLLPFCTARQNIALAREALGLPDDGTVEALTRRLDIERLLDMQPGKLSVGERQRVAIARALASHPPVVLADEPTAALDPLNAQSVMRLFVQLAEELGCTVVLVTHAPDMAAALGFRAVPVCVRREGAHVHARIGGTPCA